MIYPWQDRDWEAFARLREKQPHAILLHGPAGIGKRQFARHAAQAMLCEVPLAQGHPCGECAACLWFAHRNHPDFRLVRPEAMALAEGTPEFDDGADAAEAAAAPAADTDGGGQKSRAPNKEIRIEQIRGLLGFVNVGTHRAGLRVIVLYPLETMKGVAANALLKTLEEPPPDTVFLLVTDRIDQVLPTILSRCRKFALHPPEAAQALQWLEAQQIEDAATALFAHGGAPLAAFEAQQADDRPLRQWLLEQLGQGPRLDVLAAGEHLQKATVPMVLAVLQRWAHDLLQLRLGGGIRYFPQHQAALQRCASGLSPVALTRHARWLAGQRRDENHPLVARLWIENLLLEYRRLFEAA